jgi:hypothetical protein
VDCERPVVSPGETSTDHACERCQHRPCSFLCSGRSSSVVSSMLSAPVRPFAALCPLCSSLLVFAPRRCSRHVAPHRCSSSLLFAPLRFSSLHSSSPFAPRRCAPLRHSHRVAALLFAIRTASLRSSSPSAPRGCGVTALRVAHLCTAQRTPHSGPSAGGYPTCS